MSDKDMSAEVPEGEDFPTVETTAEWVNYGDMNPKAHGGTFIKWDDSLDAWKVVHTMPPSAHPDEVAQGRHMVEQATVYMDDLFVDGDPENGPTDFFKKSINSLSNVNSYLHALVDFPIEYFVHDWVYYRGDPRHSWWDDDKYWENLSGHGIDPDEYRD